MEADPKFVKSGDACIAKMVSFDFSFVGFTN